MSITSYAQNFEDVMLWRALGHIPNGFYIDVGAQHPVIDSVSKAFYEHGWRGVHVEATPVYATLVRADRPDELVLQVALSDKPGSLTFYEIPDTGLSTGDASIAEHHRSRGYNVVETVVPCITLADVFTQAAQQEVHWLKIDVEGMEALVLAGWGDCPVRPWVLVVESTYPNSQVQTHQEWESMVLARGYVHTYFDGLSRYYVLAERPDLAQKFNTPPNIFDGFSLAPSVPYNGPTRDMMQRKEQKYQDELAGERANAAHELQTVRETLAQREDALGVHLSQLQHQVAIASEQQTAALAAHNAEAAQQIETLRQQHADESLHNVEKERALHTSMQQLLHQAEQEKTQLVNSYSEEERALRRQHTEREQAIARQLQTSQEERLRLQQERIEREQALLKQTNQAKQEVESLLRTQVQRERAFAEKVEAVRGKAAQESAELARTLTEQQHALHDQHAAREQALGQQLEAGKQEHRKREQTLLEQTSQAKQEVENLLRTQAQREREVLEQLLTVQQQATREKTELTRSHAEKERELGNQQAQREKALTQQLHAHQQELRNLQKDRVKREHEAAQEKAELLQKQSEQEQALHRQHSEREAALTQQMQELQQLLQRQQQDGAQLEQALNNQIATLQNETQTLHQAQQLQAQQHGLELSNKLDEHTRLLGACTALEAQLQAEMQSGQQASLHLRQLLAEVQHSLEMTHTSLSWRITASLRKLAGLFTSNKNQTPTPVSFSESMTPERGMQVATEPPLITVTPVSLEPTMPPLAQATTSNMPTIASTLPELLAYHDQHFIQCAYRTLLGREPDPEGMKYYLGRLRTGFSKIQIVWQLRASKEGKTHAANLPGLDTALQQYRRSQLPLLGCLSRLFNNTESNHPTERKLRAIENQLYLLSDENNRRFNQVETALAGLHHVVVQQAKSFVTSLGGTPMPPPDAPSTSISPIQSAVQDELRQLSPRARDIYFQLETAAATYAGRPSDANRY